MIISIEMVTIGVIIDMFFKLLLGNRGKRREK